MDSIVLEEIYKPCATYQTWAWTIGRQTEYDVRDKLEAVGIKVKHNLSNANEPDLEREYEGIEVKHRSGRYPTTTRHVINEIMPKFYKGTFNDKRFYPDRDSKGEYVVKPHWAHREKLCLMDKIAAPTHAATNLLARLGIRIVTIWELIKEITSNQKGTQPSDHPIYSFPYHVHIDGSVTHITALANESVSACSMNPHTVGGYSSNMDVQWAEAHDVTHLNGWRGEATEGGHLQSVIYMNREALAVECARLIGELRPMYRDRNLRPSVRQLVEDGLPHELATYIMSLWHRTETASISSIRVVESV